MANQYVFNTVLEGFVNVYEPSGKYNNCCFQFVLPSEVMDQAEKDREELLAWAKTKVQGRVNTNLPKWDENGLVKISYDGDTGRPAPVFVDTEGTPIEKAVLKDVRKGTKVQLIVQQKPYTKPSLGTTLKVIGVMIIELASGSGAVDSGDLSAEDVAAIFKKQDGFKQSAPAVRDATPASVETDSYDF